MVVLDTDHMTLIEWSDKRGSARLRARLRVLQPAEVATTIISYEEQMRGWMAYLARTRFVVEQMEAYRRLHRQLHNYCRIPVLTFDEHAATTFQRLRRARIRIGTMDLKIAAIVLSCNATLLSRNLADFRQVPDLRVEGWTS
jgi:tRNA(fMet)-specific endonuclease VapC